MFTMKLKTSVFDKSLVVFFSLLFVSLGGCVVVPYSPGAKAERIEVSIADLEDLRISIGPRRFLQEISEAVKDADPGIEVADALQFRDSVYPDGGWEMKSLFEADTQARARAFNADYLVLVGSPKYEEGKNKGLMLVFLGFWGVGKSERSGELSALIFDLRTCRYLGQEVTKSHGTGLGAGWFFALFVYPRVERSVVKGLGEGLAKTLAEAYPSRPLRVVIMAVEE